MNKSLLLPLAISVLALGACSTDNDYDLSNIDTTARIPVNAFSVPLKSATVKLDDMLDISDESKIQKVNDKYFVQETGNIDPSSSINVKTFEAPAKSQNTNGTVKLDIKTAAGARSNVPAAYQNFSLTGDIISAPVTFESSAEGVSTDVVDATKIGVSGTMNIKVKINGLNNTLKAMHVKNLNINFAKGLEFESITGASYDNGILKIGDFDITKEDNYEYKISMKLKSITIGEGCAATFDSKAHKFNIAVTASIIDGAKITAAVSDLVDSPQIPTGDASYNISSEVSAIKATSFSGTIKYDKIENINPKSINLGEIPSILKETETNIELSNPQIYLTLNNTVHDANKAIKATAGLKIIGNNTISTVADAIVMDKAVNNICIAPKNENIKDGYTFVSFPDLKKVLAGGALPSTITIEVINPTVPEQVVSDFQLGSGLGTVSGTYEFYTPLELTSNSKIVYTKDFDADNDSFDELTITSATIEADVEKTVPLDLSLTVNINSNDKSAKSMQGKADLKHDAKTVTISLTGGPISKISGLNVKAEIKGTDQTLSPSQEIILKNIKLKVNGYYEKKL